jgi:hypothetical protein
LDDIEEGLWLLLLGAAERRRVEQGHGLVVLVLAQGLANNRTETGRNGALEKEED